MKRWFFVFAAMLAFAGCSTEQDAENVVNESAAEQESFSVEPNSVATIELTGMTCEMGCGGEIRKALKASGAVASTSFDFQEERAFNVATVKFDNADLNEQQIRKIIEGLNEGQYKVNAISIQPIEHEQSRTENSSESSDKAVVNMRSSKLEFPNLFELLSGFIL
jgi:copper chaperone CopZ